MKRTELRNLRIVVVTGLSGSGKSTVAALLREHGIPVLDADRISREVTAPGGRAYDAVVDSFGRGILGRDGSIDRKRLGEIVFSDAALRERLERITHPAILDTIKSTYVQEQADTKEIRITSSLQTETEIVRWQLRLLGADKVLATQEGAGAPPAEVSFALEGLGLRNLAQLGQVSADLAVKDKEGNVFSTATAPIGINFIRREERIAQKIGNKVVEKYGLILFDFDRAELKDRNQVIVNRVLARVAELKGVAMDIAGHTDSIGKEKYNIELSGRRAKAVYDSTLQSGIAAEAQITHAGNGPNNPPYDNSLPEGRSLNRTVIINLQYTE